MIKLSSQAPNNWQRIPCPVHTLDAPCNVCNQEHYVAISRYQGDSLLLLDVFGHIMRRVKSKLESGDSWFHRVGRQTIGIGLTARIAHGSWALTQYTVQCATATVTWHGPKKIYCWRNSMDGSGFGSRNDGHHENANCESQVINETN